MGSNPNAIPSLAAFAAHAVPGGGRLYEEPASIPRGEFQRDRDRIVHSTAFRRLQFKTQVFVYHEGDHYRTRLTHSLEVAQVARSIARALGLDEDLAEALALAHDLGHPPFGHAGEAALDKLMLLHGGFDHNAQSLRVVTWLERRYGAFDGLNLCRETLDGLLKHNGPFLTRAGKPAAAYANRPVPGVMMDFAKRYKFDPANYACAEAQAAAIADDIAYNAHDIDDGLRAGLFDLIDLGDVPLAGSALAAVLKKHPRLERPRLVHETVRRVISSMIDDVVAQTRAHIKAHKVRSLADIVALEMPLVTFSPQMHENNRMLKSFLTKKMYRHDRVLEIMQRAQRIIDDLFHVYMEDTTRLPENWLGSDEEHSERQRARQISDFIAGMTDRYAIEQHKHLFDLNPVFG